MLIDWFTVGAQVINFAVLVWLMKRFLYKPVLDAISAREKRIAAELADADEKKAEAQQERDQFQHKNEVFDQQRAAFLSQAMTEVQAERQRLLGEARQAADILRVRREETLKNEARNLNQAILDKTQQEVFAIARQTLTDLAATSLEQRMVEVFTHRLSQIDATTKITFAAALKDASGVALMRTAFELPPEQRAALEQTLQQTFSTDITIRFEVAPSLVSGIELAAGGQKVSWSIADYLTSLEQAVGQLLNRELKQGANPQSQLESSDFAAVSPSNVNE